MKRIIVLSLAFLLVVIGGNVVNPIFVSASDDIKVTFNGAPLEFDQPPIVENGRTLVPMRTIFEAFGATIEWRDDTQSVIATRGDIKIIITIDSTIAFVNGEISVLDVPAKVLNGRTLVPVRFVSEALDCDVTWDDATQTVMVENNFEDSLFKDYYPSGELAYEGEMKDGKAHGFGTFYYPSGAEAFIGEFVDGDFAYGLMLTEDGQFIYEGSFKDDAFHGEGLLYQDENEFLYANFVDGVVDNIGGIIYYYGEISYAGQLIHNGEKYIPHGTGTGYGSDGAILYAGEHKNGKWDGFGTYYHTSGMTYVGDFRNGIFDGYGKIYDENGNFIEDVQATNGELASLTPKSTYQSELNELLEWYTQQNNEIREYVNTNPLETELGKSIMEIYLQDAERQGLNRIASGAGNNGGNISSYAAANAASELARIKALGTEAAIKAHNDHVADLRRSLEQMFETKLMMLKIKWGVE